jgi:sugar lactone lactonase YvrE
VRRFVLAVAGIVAALVLVVRIFFGGGARLDDRTTAPALPASAIEVVANLDHPPGNVAVSADGRVFFTYHPDGDPPVKVLELRDGKPVPYPVADQSQLFDTVLSLRIDARNRLWTLDHARYGRGQPRLLAFDLATGAEVHRYEFPSDVAGFLSMLNDFQIDATGEKIYIAEASPIVHTPAVIVYDTTTRTSRRVLDRHPSVRTEDYRIQAPGRDMVVAGIFTLRIGIDSISLDRNGEWLYYGPVTGGTMYRVRTHDLNDATLSADSLGQRVERFAPKTISDGLGSDDQGNVYVTDPEHSAVLALGQDRQLRTLVKDPRLRWPDGMSFGPDGWLYVSCSALQHVLFVPASSVRAHAPYQLFRFKPGGTATPGQ